MWEKNGLGVGMWPHQQTRIFAIQLSCDLLYKAKSPELKAHQAKSKNAQDALITILIFWHISKPGVASIELHRSTCSAVDMIMFTMYL